MALSVVNALSVLSCVGYSQFKSKHKSLSWGTRSLKNSKFSETRKAGISESLVNSDKDDEGWATLKPLWDDGHGTATMKDFLEIAIYNVKSGGGDQLQWFCPIECGRPLNNSPILFYLPGMDGLGSGLVMHHKALGR
ncbi:hypothetical protein POM88_045876 [Heracleum sosnowskyi]|uniref:Uncharacterized protein n=1 Tax=Heracleum sosnowskyi TaxID=360622 RepID=A0AAD8H5A9_9APIA|nr:hypothetical protein POM88_045876 [Heracleum sosnowskyi]